jgi:hypothetical protein
MNSVLWIHMCYMNDVLFVFCFVSFFFHFTFELPPLVNIQLAGYQKLIIARRILIHQWNMLQHWKKWFLHLCIYMLTTCWNYNRFILMQNWIQSKKQKENKDKYKNYGGGLRPCEKKKCCSLNIISCSHSLLFCSHKTDILFPQHTVLLPQHYYLVPQYIILFPQYVVLSHNVSVNRHWLHR